LFQAHYKANKELIEFMKGQGPFPILDLPNEIISKIFPLLHMKDRLRARVNRRLNKIEVENKYHVNALYILEQPINEPILSFNGNENSITFFEEKSYSSECINRISRNVSIGNLWIEMIGSNDFHREVYNLIKECDIEKLYLRFKNDEMENAILVDSYFLDITRTCSSLILRRMTNVSAEALYQVYKNMMLGEVKLRILQCSEVSKEICVSLLRLIGITCTRRRFLSNRDDIEVYLSNADSMSNFSVFDGLLEVEFRLSRTNGSVSFGNRGGICYKVHTTLESLQKKKHGKTKMEIVPE
ncbi:hypothetical protein PMAYCL1PPCAC_01639, partial [Pristionchus mayeri]